MPTSVEFTVSGIAVSRSARSQRRRDWIDRVRGQALEAAKQQGQILDAPVSVGVLFIYRFKTDEDRVLADLDNMAKTTLDGLTGTVLRDDVQINKLSLQRFDGKDPTPERFDRSQILTTALSSIKRHFVYIKITDTLDQ